MNTRLGSTQTKNFGHYIHFAGNVLLWGKSVVRIEIHFFKSKCFQGSYSSQDADVRHRGGEQQQQQIVACADACEFVARLRGELREDEHSEPHRRRASNDTVRSS